MPPSAIKNNAALTADTLKRNKKPFIDINVVWAAHKFKSENMSDKIN